MEISNLRKD